MPGNVAGSLGRKSLSTNVGIIGWQKGNPKNQHFTAVSKSFGRSPKLGIESLIWTPLCSFAFNKSHLLRIKMRLLLAKNLLEHTERQSRKLSSSLLTRTSSASLSSKVETEEWSMIRPIGGPMWKRYVLGLSKTKIVLSSINVI